MEHIHVKKKGGVDWILISLVLILMILGLLMLANATGFPDVEEGADWLQYVASMNTFFILRHIMFFLIGCALAGVIMAFDYRIYGELSWILAAIAVFLLISVRLFGMKVYGQYRFEIFGQEVQPSEMIKLVLIIVLAWDLSKREKGVQTLRELAIFLIKAFVLIGLVLLQNDIGTALVYLFITAIMLFISGTKKSILFGLAGAGLAAIIPVWNIIGDTQKLRILTFLQPELDPSGSGYNVINSKLAIGSGQLTGKGFFNPTAMSQLNYIPVQYTDFIFTVTGETLGFWGSAIIVLLFLALLVRMVILSMQSYDKFGSYVIIGVTAMMFIHIFENIGMSIGIIPVTGIPLPFFSYGGSSMITNLMGIGLILCVHMRRKRASKTQTITIK